MTSDRISTVLVTGAAGGIGWRVSQMLLEKGVSVVGFDNFAFGLERPQAPGLTWENVDVGDPLLPNTLSKYPIDAIVHCAARLAYLSMKEPAADVRTNCFGSMQIFEWAARNNVKRVVFTSSTGVYGVNPPQRPIKETDPVKADTVYSASKLACESFLELLEQGYGLSWTVLRLFATYGPTHKPSKSQGVLNAMMTQLADGNDVIVKGSADRVRDMVYVDDTAGALVSSLLSKEAHGKIMNVGTGQGSTVRDMIYFIAEAMGKRREDINIKEVEGVPGDPFISVADISLIQKTIGFKPQVSLREGVARLVAARMQPVAAAR